MRHSRLATAVLVAALCSGAAGRVLRRREDPVLKELEKYETAPTEEELAKVEVHIDTDKEDAPEEKPAGPKLGTPKWRQLVKDNSLTVETLMHNLRSKDLAIAGERATLRDLRKRGAEPEVVQQQEQVVADSITSLEQTRRNYHIAADRLSRLLQEHPAAGGWHGSTEDPLWAPAMELVQTATYDGTWLQYEKLERVKPFEDHFHTYQGDKLWADWTHGKQNPSPQELYAKHGVQAA